MEQQQFSIDQLKDAIELAIYQYWQEEIFSEYKAVREFQPNLHNATIKRFQDYDYQLSDIQRKQVAFHSSQHYITRSISSGRVSEYSNMGLIKHESSKKARYLPIRNLFSRSQSAIQALKPCFMMSPMSVAQYLEAGKFEFDVIIMDEASQILPKECIFFHRCHIVIF